jgi:hypothetical protein
MGWLLAPQHFSATLTHLPLHLPPPISEFQKVAKRKEQELYGSSGHGFFSLCEACTAIISLRQPWIRKMSP